MIQKLSSVESFPSPIPATFAFLRKGDWTALQLLGPAIESVRLQVRESKERIKLVAQRKLQASMEGEGKERMKWQRGKKVLPLMKLGLMMVC